MRGSVRWHPNVYPREPRHTCRHRCRRMGTLNHGATASHSDHAATQTCSFRDVWSKACQLGVFGGEKHGKRAGTSLELC